MAFAYTPVQLSPAMEMDAPRRLLAKLIADTDTDLTAVSRGIGKNHAYLQQYMRTGKPRNLPEDVREALSIHFGSVNPDDFRGGVGEQQTIAIKGRRDPVTIAGEDYALLPVFDLRLSAGAGAWHGDDSEPMRWEPYRYQWLRSITAASAENLMLARVEGDSMEATLYNGDHVLIDRTRRRLSSDGIYGYRRGDALNVKRISVNPRSGLVTIISDNKDRYPPYADVDPDDLDVIGRVIWLGRQV